MKNPIHNKPSASPVSGDRGRDAPDGPPSGGGMRGRNHRDSLAWPIVAAQGATIGSQLASQNTVQVRVHAGIDPDTRAPVELAGQLRQRRLEHGEVEIQLELERPLTDRFEAYALYAGALQLGPFKPLTLGRDLVRLAPTPPHAPRPEPSLVLRLGASGASEPRVRHEAGELSWNDGRLTIRLDRPPLWRGLPIVVETRYLNSWNKLNSSREVVSLAHTAKTPHGYVEAELSTWVPREFGAHSGHVERYEITARPLRADELDLLDSHTLRTVLARQEFAAIPRDSDGQFTARLERQTTALLDPLSDFFLRVARKEVVA